MKKFSIFAALFTLLAFPGMVRASEGYAELTNRQKTDARCIVNSMLLQDLNYDIQVNCRDILYPGGVEVVNYVAWANPTAGGNAFRLGTLSLGKVKFKTKIPFQSVYVTIERDRDTRTPSGPVLMQGSMKKYQFLESSTNNSTTQTSPTPEATPEEEVLTPTPAPRSGIAALLTGGVVAVLGVFAIIFVLFVIVKR